MKFPWQKVEVRESSYTDNLVSFIQQRASGAVAKATATSAVQAAAGIVSRAFSAAVPNGPEMLIQPLTPFCLGLVGRALIRAGECVMLISVDRGRVWLHPASDWDVTGGYDELDWTYRVNLAGPSRTITRQSVSGESILHFRYSVDPERPWHGIGPIQSAALAGKLSAETSAALGDESAMARATLLPMPGTGGQDATVTALKADLKTAKGGLHLVESMASGWKAGDGVRGQENDWKTVRIGAEPPASMVELQSQASREILSACGFSPALFDATAAAASREAWRQALHGVIAPMARLVQAEMSVKLEADITLDFDGLMASDIQGRARAFQSMVGGGMDVAKAAGMAGLMVAD